VVEVATCPGKPVNRKAIAESPSGTSEVASAKAAAHMSAAESTAHVSATTETAGVSTPAAATVSTSAERKRVSGQSSGERGSRGQNYHRPT
jgi:hypothetical protein